MILSQTAVLLILLLGCYVCSSLGFFVLQTFFETNLREAKNTNLEVYICA